MTDNLVADVFLIDKCFCMHLMRLHSDTSLLKAALKQRSRIDSFSNHVKELPSLKYLA